MITVIPKKYKSFEKAFQKMNIKEVIEMDGSYPCG